MVRENGSLTGLVSGLGVNEIHLIVPETGFRQNEIGDLDPNGPGDTFVGNLDGDLPGLLRQSGTFLIEVTDGALGRTLLPVNIGDPQFDGILLGAPEFVNQGDKFELTATLPQRLIDLLDPIGIDLKLDLGDGRVFDVAITDTTAFVDLGLDTQGTPSCRRFCSIRPTAAWCSLRKARTTF